MNFPFSIDSTSKQNTLLSSFSFGEPSFNNSNTIQVQMNTTSDLLKQPNTLRKQNYSNSFDNQGHLFINSNGMETIYQHKPIETELIKALSVAFTKNLDQITITMNNSYKTFSRNIQRILSEKAQSNSDFIPYLIQFCIFDFFIVNYDNISYKFKIRDELIYKLFPPNINQFELFKSNNPINPMMMSKSTIETQIHKVTFLLLICDFSQAIQIIQALISAIEISQVNYIQANYKEYIDFFMNLGRFCEHYSEIIKETNAINANYTQIDMIIEAMIKEMSQEMERILKGIKTNTINTAFNTSLIGILLLIKGDANTIAKLLNDNRLSWHFILLCHIYYRGYQTDFLNSLKHSLSSLNFQPKDILEKDLVNTINNSVTNQLEAIKGLKANVPLVLYFSMLSIVNDMELINQMDESINIYKYEYTEFLNSLYTHHNISLNDFIAYFFAYIDTNDNSNMIFIHNFAVKKIEEIFHSGMPNEEIKKQIDSIKESIKGFQMMKDSLVIINRICFHNYLRLNDYKECIQAYLDYNRLVKENCDNSSSSGSTFLESDPLLSERNDMFDLVLSLLLKDDHQDWESLGEVCSWLSEKKDLPPNVDFLWRYVDFRFRLKRKEQSMNNDINEFFGYCFVRQPYPGCPAMLWLLILNQIKELLFNNKLSLIKENAATALGNLLLYEDTIKRRMRQYWSNNRITIDGLFEELTNFLFDLKTNMGD